jgi:hypothetical protein|tara:strand:- start:92 stop:358 length:267 start_codon:yes stop_codon:yes gene_type:complete
MSIYKRKFIASSKLFWGFTKEYDIRLYDNLDQITKDFHESLVSLLKINNLEVLVEECEKCNFHCHTHFTFEEILLNENNRDIYLCDGC